MNCAKQIARRHAVSNSPRLNSRPLERHSQSIIGQSRCRPDKERNITDLPQATGKDIAPGKNVAAEIDGFCGQNNLYLRFVEPPVDTDRAALVDVSRNLGAWSQQEQPVVSLRQSVRNAIGCGGVIHVEKNSGPIQSFRARLCVPITR